MVWLGIEDRFLIDRASYGQVDTPKTGGGITMLIALEAT